AGALTTTLLWLSTKDPVSIPRSSSTLGKNAESKAKSVKPVDPSSQSIGEEKQKTGQQPVSQEKRRPAEKNNEKIQSILEDKSSLAQSVISREEQKDSIALTGASGTESAGVPTAYSQQTQERPIV